VVRRAAVLSLAVVLGLAFVKVASSTECDRADCDTPFHATVDVALYLSIAFFVTFIVWEAVVELMRRRNQ
jgi:hypothetical protein